MPDVYRGQWWVPGEESRWPGRLGYVDGRLELDVDLPSSHPVLKSGFSLDYPVLLGETNSGTAITVVDVQAHQTRAHIPGRAEVIFRPRFAVLGAWFEAREELLFEQIDVRFQLLERWLDVSGFDFNYLGQQEGFDLSYRIPESLEVGRHDEITITAEFRASGPQIERPLVNLRMEQRARLRISSPTPGHLDAYTETLRRIRNLLSFAARTDVHAIELHGRTEGEVHRPGTPPSAESQRLRLLTSETELETPDVHTYEMLISCADAPSGGEKALSRWMRRYELIGPIFELFLITRYQPRIYLHLQFLSLAQAVESLYARKFPDWELPKAAFDARVREIFHAALVEHRVWLNEKLRY